MSTMSLSHATTHAAIESVQQNATGAPRFCVTPPFHAHDWTATVEVESAGGVAAEFRLFLDAQLGDDDLLLDLDPAFGFVSLSAATKPDTRHHVLAIVDSDVAATTLQEDARRAGVSLDLVHRSHVDTDGLAVVVRRTHAHFAQLFVHVAPDRVHTILTALQSLSAAGRITAILSDPSELNDTECALLHRALTAAGFTPHQLVERNGEAILIVSSVDHASTPIIALHARSIPQIDVTHVPSLSAQAVARSYGPINFIAPFCRTGYGVTGAHLLKALVEIGADVAYFPLGAVDRRIADVPTLDKALARQDNFDAQAPSVRLAQQFDLATHVGSGERIGFPIFENDRFTARELHHLKTQDQLLVCSSWAREVLRDNGMTHIPIHIVPLGVDRAVFHEMGPVARSVSDTVFMQIGKLEPRKGQLELLRAFEAAFRPTDAVRLSLYCHNPFIDAATLARALHPFRTSPMSGRIDLHTDPLATQHDVARVMRGADCGVFCSRAEGWNLEALEMLAVGKSIIATNYSGHTEFLTDDNARLVHVDDLEMAGVGSWAAFGARQHEQLVEHLHDVHAARRGGPLDLNRAGIATATRFSWTNTATQMLRALNLM